MAADIVQRVREWPGDGQAVREAATEIETLRKRVGEVEGALERIELGARNLDPYLKWQMSPESPGYHPTFPSAIAYFKGQFDPAVFEPGMSRFERFQQERRARAAINQEEPKHADL